MQTWCVWVWVLAVGCSKSHQDDTASVSPSATAAAAEPSTPRPLQALTRERVGLAVTAGPAKRVGVTLDLPTSWGVEPDETQARFTSCLGALEILGGSVSVQADPCEEGEAKEACIDRVIAKQYQDATKLDDVGEPKLDRFVAAETTFDKGAGPVTHHSGGRHLYDPSTHSVATCGYFSTSDRELDRFRDTCRTFALDPAAVSASPLAPRKPAPDGEVGNAGAIPHGDELASIAKAFHAAISRGDANEAARIGEGGFCDRKPAKERADCKSQMASGRDALQAGIQPLSQAASKIDPVGFWFTPLSTGPGGPAMYFAYPIPADRPCELQMEVAWPVGWIEGGAVVVFAMSKKE